MVRVSLFFFYIYLYIIYLMNDMKQSPGLCIGLLSSSDWYESNSTNRAHWHVTLARMRGIFVYECAPGARAIPEFTYLSRSQKSNFEKCWWHVSLSEPAHSKLAECTMYIGRTFIHVLTYRISARSTVNSI
jgi:hypothetical protein